MITTLKNIPEVVECHFITGNHSVLIKIYCFNQEHLMQIIFNKIQSIPGVSRTETWISLAEPIERQIWVKEYDYQNKHSKKRERKQISK